MDLGVSWKLKESVESVLLTFLRRRKEVQARVDEQHESLSSCRIKMSSRRSLWDFACTQTMWKMCADWVIASYIACRATYSNETIPHGAEHQSFATDMTQFFLEVKRESRTWRSFLVVYVEGRCDCESWSARNYKMQCQRQCQRQCMAVPRTLLCSEGGISQFVHLCWVLARLFAAHWKWSKLHMHFQKTN